MPAALLSVIFVVLLVIAIPVSITLGIASVLPSVFDPSFTLGAKYLIRAMFGGLDSFPLLAVPMFVLSGIIMAKGGISKKLFDVFAFFLGNFTAGMPCAVIVTCLFYGAISGSAPATVAAVGSMTSLFLAGVIPGLMIGLLLMLYAIYHCRRYGEDREKIHAEIHLLHEKGLFRVLRESFFALLSPVIILGCIYSGIASPTEAAVISVFYALFVSLFLYRTMKFRDIPPIFVEAIRTFTPILFILAASTAFSRVLTLMQVPQAVSSFILEHFNSPVMILLVINLFLLIVGMVMDTTPAILILTPILLPIVTAINMDPVQFGVIMVVNLAIGFVTPPIGVNLFVASSLTDVPIMAIAKKAMPMIGLFLVALLLITFIPALSLGLL